MPKLIEKVEVFFLPRIVKTLKGGVGIIEFQLFFSPHNYEFKLIVVRLKFIEDLNQNLTFSWYFHFNASIIALFSFNEILSQFLCFFPYKRLNFLVFLLVKISTK